jgi:hypothetical protein
MARNYWLTMHWPPLSGEQNDWGVYLTNENKKKADGMRIGDYVWIYQTAKGPVSYNMAKKRVPYERGRKGVIALVKVAREMKPIRKLSKINKDGKKFWWTWKFDVKLVRNSGFVSCKILNGIMGYKPGCCYRGFSLKSIEHETHEKVMDAYAANH